MASIWYRYEVQNGISDILQSYIHTNGIEKKLLECPGTVGIIRRASPHQNSCGNPQQMQHIRDWIKEK
jgi:hypothetical protein